MIVNATPEAGEMSYFFQGDVDRPECEDRDERGAWIGLHGRSGI